MGASVSLINGHTDNDDIWKFKGDDIYECRKCKSEIMVAKNEELPSYCKNCENWR